MLPSLEMQYKCVCSIIARRHRAALEMRGTAGIRVQCERGRRDCRAVIENGWLRTVLAHQINLQLNECQQLVGKVANFSCALYAPKSELVLPTTHRATIKGTTACLEVV